MTSRINTSFRPFRRGWRKLLNAGLLTILLVTARTGEACPYCIKSSGGYIDRIFVPIGSLLMAPFVIFLILFFVLRKLHRDGV